MICRKIRFNGEILIIVPKLSLLPLLMDNLIRLVNETDLDLYKIVYDSFEITYGCSPRKQIAIPHCSALASYFYDLS